MSLRASKKCAVLALSLVLMDTGTVMAANQSNALNPDIGLVLNGTYGQFSNEPDTYGISGFPLPSESDPGTEGFSLGESELNISANIDQDWFGAFTYAMSGDDAEVENAYVQNSNLGQGLSLRAGRFFSGIGYLNEHHAHTWDFVDTALAYRALLGTQYRDDGVQLRWLAPLDLYTEFGVEAFRGDGFPAGGGANNGRGTWTAFVHVGGDISDSQSWRAGLSYLHAKSEARESGDENSPDLFTGTSKIVIVDAIWKWAPNGNASSRNLTVQGEYLRSENKGEFTAAGTAPNQYEATPSGWYVQTVYQLMPRWRIGLRHDELNADAPGSGFSATVLDDRRHDPSRNSVMLDFSNSEFSRLRLQYNRDQSSPNSDDQWFLQYTMSLGAHGAHIF